MKFLNAPATALVLLMMAGGVSAQGVTKVGSQKSVGSQKVSAATPVVTPATKQNVVVCPTGTNTITCTFGSPITANSHVQLGVVSNGSTSTCVMTGESPVKVNSASNNAGAQFDTWVIQKAVGGQTVMSCTTGTSSVNNASAAEITNPTATTTGIDACGNAHAVTTALTVSTIAGSAPCTSASTSVATDFSVAMFAGGTTPYSITSPYALCPGASVNDPVVFACLTTSSTGVQTANGTSSSGSTNIPEGIVVWHP